jgi:hypothetical protein
VGAILQQKTDKMGTASYITLFETMSTMHPVECGGMGVRLEERSSTLGALLEVSIEWPEIVKLYAKLRFEGEARLDEDDRRWLIELSEVTGWELGDVVDEVRNLDIDPSERVSRYRGMFEHYYEQALRYKEEGDTRQAGEKIWGAVLALVKLYASLKRASVIHWSRGKIENFITNNVETRYRELFRTLVDKANVLHEHFYEGYLDTRSFEERWGELLKLLEKVREIVFKDLQ